MAVLHECDSCAIHILLLLSYDAVYRNEIFCLFSEYRPDIVSYG